MFYILHLKLVCIFDAVGGVIVKVVGVDQIKRRVFCNIMFCKKMMVIDGEAEIYSIKINKLKGA